MVMQLIGKYLLNIQHIRNTQCIKQPEKVHISCPNIAFKLIVSTNVWLGIYDLPHNNRFMLQTGITKQKKGSRNNKKVRRKMTAAEREAKMRELDKQGLTLDDYYDSDDDGKF